MSSRLFMLAFGVVLLTAHAASAQTVTGPQPVAVGHRFEPGPIVYGHHRQPTRNEIEERMHELAARTLRAR